MISDADIAAEINVLASRIYTINVAKGHWARYPERFEDERSWIGERVALAHTELSEIIEASRETKDPEERYREILGELADVIIRCLDMAYVIHQFDDLAIGDNLGDILFKKIRFNQERPHLHGKRW